MSLPPPPQPQQYPPQQQQYPPQPQQYYAPPPVAPVGPAPGITYAGFLSRFIAYLIDGFIIGIIEVLLIIVVGGAIGVSAAGDRVNGAGVGIGFLLFLIGAVIIILWKPWFWSHGGQTPAYKIMRLRVVRAVDGGPVSFGTAFLRFLGYIVSGAVLYLGFIWVGIDDRKQGWHDKIAGTVVINQP